MRTAVDHLMDIFKKQATGESTGTNTQRVLRQQCTQAQRVQSEEAEVETKGQWMPSDERNLGDNDLQTTKPLEVEYPPHRLTWANQPRIVSQADSPPSRNTSAYKHQ